MAYNSHSAASASANKVTNFNAPLLHSVEENPEGGADVDTAVKGLLTAGVSSRKMVLGVPAYAHVYAGVASTNGGLYQPYTGLGPGTYVANSGILTYREVMEKDLPACGAPHWDDASESSYLYCAETKVFISPTMAGDVAAKAGYVIKQNMRGLMLWELGADTTDEYRLAEYISVNLHHTVA